MSRILSTCLFLLLAAGPAAGVLHDPTRPPATVAPKDSTASATPSRSWSLTSILIASERRVATINGRPVQLGESVEGAVVKEILPASVRLEQGGKVISLRLSATAVKVPVSPEGEAQ